MTVGSVADLLVFAIDVVFVSPSAAAAIIAGRSASGPVEWKMADTGQSYRDWRGDAGVASAPPRQ